MEKSVPMALAGLMKADAIGTYTMYKKIVIGARDVL